MQLATQNRSNFEKMSAGQINNFINDPCLWILDTFFDVPAPDFKNPFMWRGNLLEKYLQRVLEDKGRGITTSLEDLLLSARKEWDQIRDDNLEHMNFHRYMFKQWSEQWFFIKGALKYLVEISEDIGVPIKYQQPLRQHLDGMGYRRTGVADFVFLDYIIEMKTKKEAEIEQNHIRQVVGYSDIMGKMPRLLYVTPGGYQIVILNEGEIRKARAEIKNALIAMEALRKNPSVELFRLYVPLNYQYWGTRHKQVASEIWSIAA